MSGIHICAHACTHTQCITVRSFAGSHTLGCSRGLPGSDELALWSSDKILDGVISKPLAFVNYQVLDKWHIHRLSFTSFFCLPYVLSEAGFIIPIFCVKTSSQFMLLPQIAQLIVLFSDPQSRTPPLCFFQLTFFILLGTLGALISSQP